MAPMKRPDSRLCADDLRSKKTTRIGICTRWWDFIFNKNIVQLVSTLMSIQFGLGRRKKNDLESGANV